MIAAAYWTQRVLANLGHKNAAIKSLQRLLLVIRRLRFEPQVATRVASESGLSGLK